MHKEEFEISPEVAEKINLAKKEKRRVFALGTTSVRALESAAENGKIKAGNFETEIFIKPDYQFQIVDALITNFHLPKSTLIMLVSAFAGRENILKAYNEAVKNEYYFFSFGDAMLIL
jgi:S-adenosylmethionine:tRNA ribosyltransferase-isomerase